MNICVQFPIQTAYSRGIKKQDFPFYAPPPLMCSLYKHFANVLQLNVRLGSLLYNAASSQHKENTFKPFQLSPSTLSQWSPCFHEAVLCHKGHWNPQELEVSQ